MQPNAFRWTVLVLTFVLAGCAVGGPGASGGLDQPNPATTRTEVSTEVESGRYFVKRAQERFRGNDLSGAEKVINRGFNVAPENPALWHLLAKIRYLGEEYDESETFATRSVNYAAEGSDLVDDNWRLIAHARQASGDEEGARRALERAGERGSGEGWFSLPFF